MPDWGGGLSGAASGYSTGSMFGGPVGGAIGAGVGGLIGLFKGKKKSPTGGGLNYDAIRKRAASASTAAYGNATRNLNRQRALQGGYSPGYITALGRMARERSTAMSEASTGAEEAIAKLMLQEKGLPSDYQRNLASIGGTMDIIGRGAEAVGSFLPNRRSPTTGFLPSSNYSTSSLMRAVPGIR